MSNPYQVGDPVVDLAQGRPMVVLEAPDQTVAEWSEANNYELTTNYANGKLGASDDEAVVRCVYVSDIRSEPSKDYTFPVSRLALIDVHHADGGKRIAERVQIDLLAAMFEVALILESGPSADDLADCVPSSALEASKVTIARQIAEAAVEEPLEDADE
jgi:hypothetical protein